nr:Chain P, NADH-ubiquinone oxidoreductase MLRQ subunit [synthetic construct]1LEK_P Chain P, dEV8 [synthetic construct]1MWA_P Chain P, DEV8 [synthetic construct]1MWA_Q Chain Q, DEV8 [synthetic construct]2CKB_P Chain P, DEV8 PEPTIDE [unidentified]2CKB_Q Chain Q, DEV8 PEPTIDE [unidentified]
EQYKFYSV